MSSLLALPCPLPGASDPLRGADSLPFPSSPDGITAVNLVKPTAKRPKATGKRPVQAGLPGLSAPSKPKRGRGVAGAGKALGSGRHRPAAARGAAVCRGLAEVPLPPPPSLAELPTGCPLVLPPPP